MNIRITSHNILNLHRCKRFRAAYDHIEKNIDQIYKDLTKSRSFPLGGTAYLSLEDNEVNTYLMNNFN